MAENILVVEDEDRIRNKGQVLVQDQLLGTKSFVRARQWAVLGGWA